MKKDTVVMKGTKSGIILVLDENTDFETLKNDVAAKFKASAAFLGEAQKAITFQGKALTEDEKLELIDQIHANCQLSIVCIMEDDRQLEQSFAQTIQKQPAQPDFYSLQYQVKLVLKL